MKNIIYTLAFIFAFSLASLNAQDISLTNTSLTPPVNNQEYGQACFTIIAEDGIELTSIPLKVEISLSKVDFDPSDVSGFNSQKFDWAVDSYSNNVLIGTLASSIADVDNGEGGAQICIPVNRSTQEDYADPRNGFAVNLVPGGIDQNTANDDIVKFGFSASSSSSLASNEDSRFDTNISVRNTDITSLNVYPNPASNIVNISLDGTSENKTIAVYNNMGQLQYENNNSIDQDQIDIQSWTQGMYIVEVRNSDNSVVESKKLIVINK